MENFGIFTSTETNALVKASRGHLYVFGYDSWGDVSWNIWIENYPLNSFSIVLDDKRFFEYLEEMYWLREIDADFWYAKPKSSLWHFDRLVKRIKIPDDFILPSDYDTICYSNGEFKAYYPPPILPFENHWDMAKWILRNKKNN